jgi:hypothetical protein
MKSLVLLILIFLTSRAFSITISAYRSVPDSPDELIMTISDNEILIKKRSNWLDTKEDYRLGDLSLKRNAKEDIKILENIKKDLIKTKKKIATLSQDQEKSAGHRTQLKIDEENVPVESKHFKIILEFIQKYLAGELILKEGISISADRKFYEVTHQGKLVSKEKFNQSYFCEEGPVPLRCLARTWGSFLYLPLPKK